MTSSDKDFRFMATNDLMAELQKDSIKLDDESERKVFYVSPWFSLFIVSTHIPTFLFIIATRIYCKGRLLPFPAL